MARARGKLREDTPERFLDCTDNAVREKESAYGRMYTLIGKPYIRKWNCQCGGKFEEAVQNTTDIIYPWVPLACVDIEEGS